MAGCGTKFVITYKLTSLCVDAGSSDIKLSTLLKRTFSLLPIFCRNIKILSFKARPKSHNFYNPKCSSPFKQLFLHKSNDKFCIFYNLQQVSSIQTNFLTVRYVP